MCACVAACKPMLERACTHVLDMLGYQHSQCIKALTETATKGSWRIMKELLADALQLADSQAL